MTPQVLLLTSSGSGQDGDPFCSNLNRQRDEGVPSQGQLSTEVACPDQPASSLEEFWFPHPGGKGKKDCQLPPAVLNVK